MHVKKKNKNNINGPGLANKLKFNDCHDNFSRKTVNDLSESITHFNRPLMNEA